MGQAANGVCFAPLAGDGSADAAAHHCAQYPVVIGASHLACVGSSGSGGVATLSMELRAPSGTVTPYSVALPLAPCDPLSFTPGTGPFGLSVVDASLVAAAVAGVWMVGFVWRSMRKALNDHNSDD